MKSLISCLLFLWLLAAPCVKGLSFETSLSNPAIISNHTPRLVVHSKTIYDNLTLTVVPVYLESVFVGIYNAHGNLVMPIYAGLNQTMEPFSIETNVSSLTPGYYCVKVTSNKWIAVEKFIVVQ